MILSRLIALMAVLLASVLVIMSPAVHPAPPPAQGGASPTLPTEDRTRPRHNVRDFGAKGDGAANDTAAVRAAIDRAPQQGAVIYFPRGTYIVDSLYITKRGGLTFTGDGFDSIIKRPPHAGNTRPMTLEDCADIVFRNLAVDENGITHFGGVNLRSVKRVLIENTRHFDSRPWSPAADGGDHYSWVMVRAEYPNAPANEDITVRNNIIENLTFEVNAVRRARIEDNRVTKPFFGIGTFSNSFNASSPTPGRGGAEDYVVTNNTIIDPLGAAIVVHLDPGSDHSTVFRRILIAGNQIRMGPPTRVGTAVFGGVRQAVSVGATTMNQTAANVFEDIEVRDNVVDAKTATLAPDEYEIGIFAFNTRGQPDFLFRRIKVVNNRAEVNPAAVPPDRAGQIHGTGTGQAHNSVFAGNVLMGISGIGIILNGNVRNNRVEDNLVQAAGPTSFAYWFGNSEGGNRLTKNRYVGTPNTVLHRENVHPSDVIEQPTVAPYKPANPKFRSR